MNVLQEQQIQRAHETIQHIRRELATIELLGWEVSEGTKQTLTDFDDTYLLLAQNARQIAVLKPDNSPAHEKKLTELLDKENYYVESLAALANTAYQALSAEQLRFFEARQELRKPFEDRIVQADATAKQGYEIVAQGLQDRWQAMGQLYELGRMLAIISEQHNTTPRLAEPERRLPKPFGKKPANTFRAMVEAYLERLGEVLANSEKVPPARIGEDAYSK